MCNLEVLSGHLPLMYKFSKNIDIGAEKAFGAVSARLKDSGFVVLSYVDVKEIIRNKFNEDFPFYFILDVCKPSAARELISRNSDYGLFLPCKVVIEGDERQSRLVMLRVSEMAESHLSESGKYALKYENELIEALESI